MGSNQNLVKQREQLMKVYEYNVELEAYVSKANGKVVALESNAWCKKVALYCLAAALFIVNVLILVLKLI